jgi:hypothetical protein
MEQNKSVRRKREICNFTRKQIMRRGFNFCEENKGGNGQMKRTAKQDRGRDGGQKGKGRREEMSWKRKARR